MDFPDYTFYDTLWASRRHFGFRLPNHQLQTVAAPFAALTGFEGVIEDAAERHLADQPEMYSPEEDLL